MPNFTPDGAMALFGGAYLKNKYHALIIPLLSLWISDLVINNFILSYYSNFTWFYPGFIWQYASFILIIIVGYFFLKKLNFKNVFITTISSSILFFLITNFGVWSAGFYGYTFSGLISCYLLAIPFFAYTFISTLSYSILIETIYYFIKVKLRIIR